MRISDWSSDVCSSDLIERGLDAPGNKAVYLGEQRLTFYVRLRPLGGGIGGKDVGGNERGLDKTPRRQKQQRRSRSPDRDIPAMIVGQGIGPRLPAWTGKGRGADTSGDPADRAEPEDENRNDEQIGRAHVCTPVTNAQPVCRILSE